MMHHLPVGGSSRASKFYVYLGKVGTMFRGRLLKIVRMDDASIGVIG